MRLVSEARSGDTVGVIRGQTLTDTQLLLELVGEAYGFEDLEQYRHGILEIITRVVPCDRVGYNEITPDEDIRDHGSRIRPAPGAKIRGAHLRKPAHAAARANRDGRPYRISDLIDQPTFHRLALYQQFYRHIGIEWQVAFTLPARAPLIVGIALTRTHTDFTDREVQLLALARPHLMQAYRNAELWSARKAMLVALEQGLDTLGQHVVVLDPGGRVEFATDGARRLLGDTVASRRGLPDEVSAWISQHHDPRAAAQPLLLHTAGRHGARAPAAEQARRSPRSAAARKRHRRAERWRATQPRSDYAPGRDAATGSARPHRQPNSRAHGNRAAHRREASSTRLRETRRTRPPAGCRDRLGSSRNTTTDAATATAVRRRPARCRGILRADAQTGPALLAGRGLQAHRRRTPFARIARRAVLAASLHWT